MAQSSPDILILERRIEPRELERLIELIGRGEEDL